MRKTKDIALGREEFDSWEDFTPEYKKDPDTVRAKYDKIMEGSCKVFFEKGYHPTTTREIATACGMSMGQLYRYIGSKDDILYLVHKNMQRMWYEHLVSSGIQETDLPLERLKLALRSTLDLMIKNKKLFQFIYTESKHLDKVHLRKVLFIDDKNVVGFFRKLLREVGSKKRLHDDIDFLANLIAYLLVFFPLRSWNLKGRPNNKNIKSLMNFILRGLGFT